MLSIFWQMWTIFWQMWTIWWQMWTIWWHNLYTLTFVFRTSRTSSFSLAIYPLWLGFISVPFILVTTCVWKPLNAFLVAAVVILHLSLLYLILLWTWNVSLYLLFVLVLFIQVFLFNSKENWLAIAVVPLEVSFYVWWNKWDQTVLDTTD